MFASDEEEKKPAAAPLQQQETDRQQQQQQRTAAAAAPDPAAADKAAPPSSSTAANSGSTAAAVEVEYSSWPVKELRRFLTERGVDSSSIVEKHELVDKVGVGSGWQGVQVFCHIVAEWMRCTSRVRASTFTCSVSVFGL